jgi:hypothetical protein
MDSGERTRVLLCAHDRQTQNAAIEQAASFDVRCGCKFAFSVLTQCAAPAGPADEVLHHVLYDGVRHATRARNVLKCSPLSLVL